MKSAKSACKAGLLIAALAVPIRAQVTERVSVDSGGAEGNGGSYEPSISANGRYVAFHSAAANLVPGDTNGHWDVFVRDRLLGVTERVSVDSGGVQGNSDSLYPSISADGRYVAYWSYATNLVLGDSNGVHDVFVRDRSLGVTERVSVDSAGAQGNSDSRYPSISADGRRVAFDSYATNLVSGDTNGFQDVFLRDRQLGATERVSVDSGGAQGNGRSDYPSISADGRNVAFASTASNLVLGDTNGTHDVFVHDRELGATERVSLDSGGVQGNGDSYYPSISGDGRNVAFQSWATNLVPGDTNGRRDVFVHHRQLGATERVSVNSAGAQGNGHSDNPSISADGRYVTFDSWATHLVPGDTNGVRDAFVRDRQLGATERVSVDSAGSQGNSGSFSPSISADGRYVTFWTDATNLVPGDTNGWEDVFLHGCDSVGTTYCAANSNSTGARAEISACCSASSAEGDLTLDAVPVPNQPGTFFHGMNQSQIAFGNGFLCTTGHIARGAVISGSGNLATYTYDNTDAKHGLAAYVGTTRNFQYWFRDPAGGGAFFNTSNAISIAILP